MKKLYPLEIVLVIFIYSQLMLDIPHAYFLTILFILTASTLILQKARAYTPLIMILVVVSSLQSSSYVTSIKIILLLIVGVLMLKIRYFKIKKDFIIYQNQSKENPKLIGYKSAQINGISVAIFYPTTQKSNKKIKWMTGGDSFWKNSMEAQEVIGKKVNIPFWLFKFVSSYMNTYHLQAYPNTAIFKKDKYELVFISHGLAGTKHIHSALAQWWASRGYIALAIQHNQSGRIKGVQKKQQQLYQSQNFNFRNQSLQYRVKQLRSIINSVVLEKSLDEIFKQIIEIKNFQLVGHSFGCPTILETAAELINTPIYSCLKGIITMDPWLYPLSPSSYIDFKKPFLNIKSQTFADKVQKMQPSSVLHEKNRRIYQLNKKRMMDLTVMGMDHVHQCDSVFVCGTLLQIIKMSRGSIDFLCEINAYLIYLFQIGKTQKQILQQSNRISKLAKRTPDDIVIRK